MTCALMYHDVVSAGREDSSGFPGRDAALYKITPERFEQHLQAIVARTAHPPIMTFDDGGASAVAAAERLERVGLRGHFLITTNYIGAPRFLDGPTIRRLHDRGHAIGSHSCSHPLRMRQLSRSRLLDEWMRSRDILCDTIGSAVTVASVPGGDLSTVVAETAACAGFTRLFTSEPTFMVRRTAGVELIGRFAVHHRTTAETVAALASGAWLPRLRQQIVWNAKKLSKRVAGHQYLQIRRFLLGHSNEVTWGDQI